MARSWGRAGFSAATVLVVALSFSELAQLCRNQATELLTYTASTSVRAAMLAAGFYVAKGRATGPKVETTIGLSPRAAALATHRELLGTEWLSKWQRSDAQAPFGASSDDESWRSAILAHPQFQSCRSALSGGEG